MILSADAQYAIGHVWRMREGMAPIAARHFLTIADFISNFKQFTWVRNPFP